MPINEDTGMWCILVHGDNVCLYHDQECLRSWNLEIELKNKDGDSSLYQLLEDGLKEFKKQWINYILFDYEREQLENSNKTN